MREYITRQGDTFESIAWFQLGNSNEMVNLIRANREHMETAVFEAGITLQLPDPEPGTPQKSTTKAPWR